MRKIILAVCFGLALIFSLATTVSSTANAETNNIQVQAIPGPTLGEKMLSRAQSSWPWYISRASGIIAAVSLVILMLSGMGQVAGYTYRFLEPLTAWASHRALGIAFGVSILVHITVLLFDHFSPFTIGEILVPWMSHYKIISIFGVNVGSLYVALGVLAFYLTILVVITSLIWTEKRPTLWKWIHILSYLIMIFVFVHALFLGTDLSSGWLRYTWIGLGTFVALAILHRLWRVKTT